MKKTKIAHVLHSVGGVDVSLRLILENIDNRNYENIIIHGKIDTQKKFIDRDGNKLPDFRVSIFRDINLWHDFKSLFQTYKILKKEKPNLIHAHSAKGGAIGRIVGFLLGIKVLYTPQAFSYLSTQNKIKRNVFLKIENLLAFKNSFILASSESEKSRAINEVGYKKGKVLLFNNSINAITKINPLKIEKTWPDNYICTVGRPSFQKNIELMIRVFFELNKTKRIHLVVMGVGHHVGQLNSVKNLIKELGMQDDVTLLNWTEQSDVFHIIKKSIFYISTSRYEGLPYSIIESFALGKPAIVSDCDGNRDLVQDGFNGFAIKNENIIEYKNRIIDLLNDNVLLEKLSCNALNSFNKNFNIKNNILALEEIYSNYAIKHE